MQNSIIAGVISASKAQEVLKLGETNTSLVIESETVGTIENKGPGDKQVEVVKHTVSYEKKPILEYQMNTGTGDVITKTIKVLDSDLLSEFFSSLFTNLTIGGSKTLKN